MKACQNCSQEFKIEPGDREFYARLSVPEPTLCPQCRLQRRLAFRNERSLYRRACDLCRKEIIAIYPAKTAFPVYCTDCWWSDAWDASSFGRDYDLTRGFFEQYRELSEQVPRLGMPSPSNNYNSAYTSWIDECKNCYLVFGSSKCEDASYAELLYACKNSLDSTNCNGIELSYGCVNSKNCYQTVWGINSVNCNDCFFCFDCRSSNNCFLSYNLRHKSYCILNQQYSPEEWKKRVSEITGSHEKMAEALGEFKKIIKEKALHRFANFVQCVNSTGNDLIESKNARYCFDSSKLEDCSYVSYGDKIKDCMDCYATVEKSELCYENFSTRVTARSRFVIGGWDSNFDISYSQFVVGSQNLFGCMALRNKSFCILNKQYKKEEYEELAKKIIADMKERGEYGEFFPISLSPFGYNETLANDYFPMKKEEVVAKSWPWREERGGIFGQESVKAGSLPDHIRDVKDSILGEILACETCGKNYRIIESELGFYRKLSLPLPRKCPDCRYYERLSFRNPRKLWRRSCRCDKAAHQHHAGVLCSNEFETSYAPERPEMVYCEQCYLREVV